jgi:hypothetical protein
MVEILSRLPAGDLAAVLIVPTVGLVVGVVALAALVIKGVQRYREQELAASLVSEMLARDVPSQEIVAILKAMGLDAPPERRIRGRSGHRATTTTQEPAA